MKGIHRVAAVNDLSGFGRCSLTVALPILSAMGFQVCPLPTAVLSAHTGYVSPYIHDFTGDMAPYLQHWQQLELAFDGVYTGFLGNERQAALLEPFLQEKKEAGALILVDPAMADHGCLYATCTEGLVKAMARLVAKATVITPNLTEACLLTDTDYEWLLQQPTADRCSVLEAVGRGLLTLGCETAVITGVPGEDGWLENWAFTAMDKPPAVVSTRRVARTFAGTGDVFASVLCGHLLWGEDLEQAVDATANWVHNVTAYTASLDAPEQDGIVFEPFLRQLCREEGF